MKTFSLLLILCVSFLLLAGCQKTATNDAKGGVAVTDADGKTVTVADSSRIVAVGTAVTETVYALGAGDRLAGVDNSSAEYLPPAAALPKVGPRTTLSAEGILSLKPTLVIMNADSGPPAVVEQLRGAGITVLTLTPNYTVETVKSKIETIAKALGAEAKSKELTAAIDRDLSEVETLLEKKPSTPKVMFVGRGPNMPNATMSGAGTTIDEMIRLAGGANPTRDFTGFREMTDEAVVAAQPDIILMTEKSFERAGGIDGVLKFPGVALTPAGRNRRIVTVSDMYFQGFGPGVGKAVRELAVKLFPEFGK
ncbi:MAG: ABC transporter substrate-binding protein [Acidobacteria bacterium]|nr:ABC transporter substrate-binding protein [Acidobacteriota bacterium]